MGDVRAARGSGRLALRALAFLAWAGSALLASALPSQAQLVIFEAPGLTLGNDPVECAAAAGYRICQSDAGTERVLSHDGLPVAERIPLDFQLLLPTAPGGGPDGLYPLVVFIHGWNGHKNSIGGGLESEFVPYAQAGYAVLAYSARAWGNSCGSSQQTNPECANQWNHLADVRFEVRDTQYFAGLLADELSDDGTPLVDGSKVGVTGVSYGGGQSTQLAGLRNRVVDLDGSLLPWTSPAGKPMGSLRSALLGLDRSVLLAAAQRTTNAGLRLEQLLLRSERKSSHRRVQVELRGRALRHRARQQRLWRRPARSRPWISGSR